MRNLKKILALVLALMMALSVMVFASAMDLEDYEDAAAVDSDYAEAVDLLTGMGIFEGDEGGFRPQDRITRAEVAALVYRVLTADVTNAEVGRYVDFDYFTDVPEDEWYAGYVNYVANGKHVVGTAEGIFAPNDNITGFEVLTIMLRAIGYGQKEEFEGDEWTIHVAQVANQLGISDGLKSTLGEAITREEVAYVIYQGILKSQVKYTPAFGYQTLEANFDNGKFGIVSTKSLGHENFDLGKTGYTMDIWGRPGHQWSYKTGERTTTIEYPYLARYYAAETECDVAEDVGITLPNTDVTTYTNGKGNKGSDKITPTQTVATIGAQGRLTEVYDANLDGDADTIVYIDTFRAEVTSVVPRTYDVTGSHVRTPATMTVAIYSNNNVNGGYVNPVEITRTSWTSDFPYSEDDVLAVNKVTNNNNYYLGPNDSYYIVGELGATVVTVNAITQNSGRTENVGFVGSNGTRYLYNCTFAGTKLGTTAIGSSYYVWTDAQGNVLKLQAVPSGAAGYGVVTGYDVDRVDPGKYVIVLDVLQADGTTDQVALNNGGSFYATLAAAESKANEVFRTKNLLISYWQNATGYYNWKAADSAAVTDGVVESGEADAINTTDLVNDNTVFFVANYTYDNSAKKYVFVDYSIYTGLKDLPYDLKNVGGTLDVTVLDDYNAVLVLDSNLQVTPEDVPVKNYAYLMTDGSIVDVGDDYHIFNAIINGVADQKLQATNSAAANIDITGLYTYREWANGWNLIETANTNIDAGNYSYSAGVLTNNTVGAADKYLTVADDCVVYIINPTTGASVPGSLSDLSTTMYGAKCDIDYQLDEDGYISLIYIVENTTSWQP